MNASVAPRTLKRFFSHAAIYGFGDLLTKFARYILIPVYIAVMTRAEIGQLAVLQATTMICWAISCLGLGAAVRRFYLSPRTTFAQEAICESQNESVSADEVRGRDAWVAGLWWLRVTIALAPMTLIMVLVWAFSSQLFPSVPAWMVMFACSTGYFRSSSDIVEAWFVIREEPMRYRALTFSQFLFTSTLILVFVLVFSMGVLGVVLGEWLAAVIWTFTTGLIITRNQRPIFSTMGLARVFRYSGPWIPHAVCMWLLVSGDRILLQQYVTNQQIGIYEISYLFGSLLMVVAQGLRAAWLPDYFRTANQIDGAKRYAKLTRVYLFAIFSCAMATICFSSEAIAVFGGVPYQASVLPCKIVTIGIVCFACFIAFNQPLLLKQKTLVLAGWSITGVLVNLSMNLWLIPKFGIHGAAFATVSAYGVMMLGVLFTCRIKFAMPIPAITLIAGLLILLGLLWLTETFDANLVGETMWTKARWLGIAAKAVALVSSIGLMAASVGKSMVSRRQNPIAK